MNAEQMEVTNWLSTTFGWSYVINKRERAMRVLEEAAELAQSLGLTRDEANVVLDQVFAKPVDPDIGKEIAGTLVCTLAAATCVGLSAEAAYEHERIWRWSNIQRCREKHAKKTAVAIVGGYPS